MEIKRMKIEDVKVHPDNPRVIRDDKFKALVKSIKDFPEMLELRPIVLNDEGFILGGNMRLEACKILKYKEVPVVLAKDLTEEQQKEFMIKDNVSFGQWDFDKLANEWEISQLDEWGMDLWQDPEASDEEEDDETYTSKIESPLYIPKEKKQPAITELYSRDKTKELLVNIEKADIDDKIKDFLIQAAQRHTAFDYSKIAEYYAHAPKEVQELMEQSALVIIDFNKAIEYGFVKISKELEEEYSKYYD